MLKRVPLDFVWPMKKIWEGYLNPYYVKCPDCENGSTDARVRLEACVMLLMWSSEEAFKQELPRPYYHNFPFTDPVKRILGKDMLELTAGLAEKEVKDYSTFGHDVVDRFTAIDKVIKAARLDPEVWGICQTCKGSGSDPVNQEKYDSWEQHDPPIGKGYQLWENTSEGSPISPVFSTPNTLADWCEQNAFIMRNIKLSKEQWLVMINKRYFAYQVGNQVFL